MSDLRQVRETLLSISHPEQVLRYADNLMEMRRKHGNDFKLNAADAWLKPLLVFYTEDLDGWVKFVKGTRDRLDPRSVEFKAVQEFYKVINVRAIQRRTRALIDAATSLAVRKGTLEDTYEAKQRYAKRCVQAWKARKDNLLKAVRQSSPTGRISVSHREEMLKDFWDTVSEEVDNGEIPKP